MEDGHFDSCKLFEYVWLPAGGFAPDHTGVLPMDPTGRPVRMHCRQILFVHALGDCDTTSAIFSIGKGTVFKRLTTGTQLVDLTDIIHSRTAAVHDVVRQSFNCFLFVAIYGGKPGNSLNTLCCAMYYKMVTVSLLRPKPQKLPPTKNAAKFHIMRAHLQGVHWS